VTHDQEEAMLLSDRIAIVNEGRLQQVGTADAIYHRPANEFVGDFVGRMNLWEGRVVASDEGGSVIELAGKARVRSVQRAPAGTSVQLAVRPEALAISPYPPAAPDDPGMVPFRVVSIRFAGPATLVQGVIGEGLDALVQVAAGTELPPDGAWLAFDPEATFFFADETNGGS
jgi:ABC-type Fe3+/spermidine/putrescine transport system ATPase subunit